MIRVLIADDHAIVREGIKHLFGLTPDLVVAGEAASGGQVVEAVRRGGIDLVLLDLYMPGMEGIQLISHVRANDARVPILILSMHNESQVVRRALKAGASGYVVKDCEPETLLTAINQVARGGRFIEPLLAEQMLFNINPGNHGMPHEVLTEREFDVMCMFAKGNTVNEISAKLSISNKTVSTHKARIMEKMRFSNNVELVRYALTHGLVQ